MTGRRLWRSAVTVSLVPEAQGGPFVFWGSLPEACRQASELGFQAIEIFAPSADFINRDHLATLLDEYELEVAAFGTGAGWLLHRLSFTDESEAARREAIKFATSMIDLAGEFGAPAIIGSLQGRMGGAVSAAQARAWLSAAIAPLQQRAADYGVPLLYEPLNRYETNLCNSLEQALALIDEFELANVRVLADLFHMNIEEVDLAVSLRASGKRLGHVHFVDSNRRAPGFGHLNFAPVIEALDTISFQGFLSAEALPWPESFAAARQVMAEYHRLTGP